MRRVLLEENKSILAWEGLFGIALGVGLIVPRVTESVFIGEHLINVYTYYEGVITLHII